MSIEHYRDKVITALVIISCWSCGPIAQAMVGGVDAKQNAVAPDASESGCPLSVLERLTLHTVQAGETVGSIAADYGLLPASVVAFNPTLQSNRVRVGNSLQIPPHDGSVQAVAPGTTWQVLADRYRMRADVLFELNGCAITPPSQVFVPGAAAQVSGGTRISTDQPDPLTFDLAPVAGDRVILTQYGWQSDSEQLPLGGVQRRFHPGIDFLVPTDTTVRAVADGTVAFVGDREDYGLLIVINHAQGLQTRYAQLSSAQVGVGDTITMGQTIGQSGQSGTAALPHLHFEVRLNSNAGWLAQDPTVYLNPLQP
ncbi:MAG: peptidoglycan DD-metalloendopeptidase family protein [Leptolyngbyaceae cyanobacterium]